MNDLHNLLVQAGLKRLVDAYWIKKTNSKKPYNKADEITKQISKASEEKILTAAYDVIEGQRTNNSVCALKQLKFKEIRDDVASDHRTHPALLLATRTRTYMAIREELFVRCYHRGIMQRDIEMMTKINRSSVRVVLKKYGLETSKKGATA